MATRHGQNDVPLVERLEDRLLFSAGLPVAPCPDQFIEKPHGYGEAVIEKPCVALGLARGDGCGGFGKVRIGREGKLSAHASVYVADGGMVLFGGQEADPPGAMQDRQGVARNGFRTLGNDDDRGGIWSDSWQTNGSPNDASNWSGTWPGIRAAQASERTQATALSQAAPGQSRSRAWHPFRHPFASRLVHAGVPIAKASAGPGRSDIRTTMTHAHLAPGHDEDSGNARLPMGGGAVSETPLWGLNSRGR